MSSGSNYIGRWIRVATSVSQGCHFAQNQPEGLSGPAKQAPNRLQGNSRFRVAASTFQGCHFVHNQPEGLSGPAKRASNRPQGDS